MYISPAKSNGNIHGKYTNFLLGLNPLSRMNHWIIGITSDTRFVWDPLFMSINLEPVRSGFSLPFLARWIEAAIRTLTRWQALVMTELTDTVGSVAQSLQLEESLVGNPAPFVCVKNMKMYLYVFYMFGDHSQSHPGLHAKHHESTFYPALSMPMMKGSSADWTSVWSSSCEEFMVLLDEVGGTKMMVPRACEKRCTNFTLTVWVDCWLHLEVKLNDGILKLFLILLIHVDPMCHKFWPPFTTATTTDIATTGPKDAALSANMPPISVLLAGLLVPVRTLVGNPGRFGCLKQIFASDLDWDDDTQWLIFWGVGTGNQQPTISRHRCVVYVYPAMRFKHDRITGNEQRQVNGTWNTVKHGKSVCVWQSKSILAWHSQYTDAFILLQQSTTVSSTRSQQTSLFLLATGRNVSLASSFTFFLRSTSTSTSFVAAPDSSSDLWRTHP